jgi:hypothetical protein
MEMMTVNELGRRFVFAALCSLFVCGLSASAAMADEGDADSFDPAQFDWTATPATVKAEIDQSFDTEHFGSYKRLSRSVTLNSENWRQFFIFHKDKLIAQGYDRSKKLTGPRVGTISDIVSYDNDYWVANKLTAKLGEPAFVDSRTRSDFSQELGDDALKLKRSLDWDLLGERYRWETDDGTIRYNVQFSMDRLQKHRVVNVNPSKWAHYFDFQTVQAFRDAGIRLIRRFRKRTQTWVVTTFGSGRIELEKYEAPGSAKPKSFKREEYTSSNCRFEGRDCRVTFKYYGYHLYQVDLDFSTSGEFPRRGRHEDIGVGFYKHFAKVDRRLRSRLGTPGDTKRIKDPDNRREMMKAENLVQGMEGFWSVWYDVGNDVLVRHTITGENTGTGYKIDHKVTFRFHSVARALTEKDAWKVEVAKAKKGE